MVILPPPHRPENPTMGSPHHNPTMGNAHHDPTMGNAHHDPTMGNAHHDPTMGNVPPNGTPERNVNTRTDETIPLLEREQNRRYGCTSKY